jgi:hypothetical protein
MRSWSFSRRSFAWFAAAACVLLATAPGGRAAPQDFSNGQLTVELFSLDPINVPPSAPLASGVLEATLTESGITTIGFPAKVFETTGLSIPITDPNADPIDGVWITAANPAATFTAAGGGAGKFGGNMPLQGTAKVCLFGGKTFCANPSANISLPLSLVGQPSSKAFTFLIGVTVKGAPWTTGTIMLQNKNLEGTVTNTVTGGIDPNGAGGFNVKLVTPIYIATAFPGSAIVPAWGVMSFAVPEPDVMALGLGAVGALALVGLRRLYA